jgi:hypothetical protein
MFIGIDLGTSSLKAALDASNDISLPLSESLFGLGRRNDIEPDAVGERTRTSSAGTDS